MDTRHIPDAIEIVAFDISAPDRARLYGRVQHAGQTDVDAINRLSRYFQRNVEALLLGSKQRVLVGCLDFDFRWVGQRRSGRFRRNRAVSGAALGLRMSDHAVLRHQLRHRHPPLVGSGQQKPLASFGACELQIVAALADITARVDDHAAVHSLCVLELDGRGATRIGFAVAGHF